jgi:2-methylisocitrate lyase-like PEP mutase family enzyme
MARTLASTLAAGEFIVAPGVFEMFSARIAELVGFPEVWEFEKRHGK